MKILLIGGSGLIGQEVQQLLQEKTINYIAPDRNELNLEHPETIDSSIKNTSQKWYSIVPAIMIRLRRKMSHQNAFK